MHSAAEMGSAGASYKAAFIARFGEPQWEARCREYDAIWQAITDAIAAMRLDLSEVKVFQDSLPVCGHEATLVHQLAQKGSHNHQLVEAMVRDGATLVGTEAPALLLEEYRLLQSPSRSQQEATALLEKRDRFIADRIAEALGEEETGILFIGALHRVARHLPARIACEYLPIHSPAQEARHGR
jgi:hypothetical protein